MVMINFALSSISFCLVSLLQNQPIVLQPAVLNYLQRFGHTVNSLIDVQPWHVLTSTVGFQHNETHIHQVVEDYSHNREHVSIVHVDDTLHTLAVCTSILDVHDRNTLLATAIRLTESYDRNQWSFKHIPDQNLSCSCVFSALDRELMWIFSDLSGTTPVFYSMVDHFPATGKRESIVTTDVLLALQLGFDELTPVGSRQSVALNMATGYVNYIAHFAEKQPKIATKTRYHHQDIELFSNRFLSLTTEAIDTAFLSIPASPRFSVFNEFDELFWMSKLSDCLMRKKQIERHTRIVPPTVLQIQYDFFPEDFRRLLGKNVAGV
jgi:hypothetical protein